jgi:hypothetical protein
MANDDHVAQLLKGAAAWNAWRDENPNVLRPNLREANLSEVDLRKRISRRTSERAPYQLRHGFTSGTCAWL